MYRYCHNPVTGLVPVTHVLRRPGIKATKTWMPGTSPGTGIWCGDWHGEQGRTEAAGVRGDRPPRQRDHRIGRDHPASPGDRLQRTEDAAAVADKMREIGLAPQTGLALTG